MIGKIIKLGIFSLTIVSLSLLPYFGIQKLQAQVVTSLQDQAIENRVPFVPSVSIPGSSKFIKDTPFVAESGNLLGEYIRDVYKFLVGIAGIAATIMIAAGGIVWLFSSGNSSRISQAKEMITGAIIGLVLALGSYLILFNINSNLVNFNLEVGNTAVGCCEWSTIAMSRNGTTQPGSHYGLGCSKEYIETCQSYVIEAEEGAPTGLTTHVIASFYQGQQCNNIDTELSVLIDGTCQ